MVSASRKKVSFSSYILNWSDSYSYAISSVDQLLKYDDLDYENLDRLNDRLIERNEDIIGSFRPFAKQLFASQRKVDELKFILELRKKIRFSSIAKLSRYNNESDHIMQRVRADDLKSTTLYKFQNTFYITEDEAKIINKGECHLTEEFERIYRKILILSDRIEDILDFQGAAQNEFRKEYENLKVIGSQKIVQSIINEIRGTVAKDSYRCIPVLAKGLDLLSTQKALIDKVVMKIADQRAQENLSAFVKFKNKNISSENARLMSQRFSNILAFIHSLIANESDFWNHIICGSDYVMNSINKSQHNTEPLENLQYDPSMIDLSLQTVLEEVKQLFLAEMTQCSDMVDLDRFYRLLSFYITLFTRIISPTSNVVCEMNNLKQRINSIIDTLLDQYFENIRCVLRSESRVPQYSEVFILIREIAMGGTALMDALEEKRLNKIFSELTIIITDSTLKSGSDRRNSNIMIRLYENLRSLWNKENDDSCYVARSNELSKYCKNEIESNIFKQMISELGLSDLLNIDRKNGLDQKTIYRFLTDLKRKVALYTTRIPNVLHENNNDEAIRNMTLNAANKVLKSFDDIFHTRDDNANLHSDLIPEIRAMFETALDALVVNILDTSKLTY